ncbi:MAG: GNAT family N-acetyltransferase [Magnetococcales bacterium]|nr:GNAT family N-acetyltransferase [Magnetococcales bacterium]
MIVLRGMTEADCPGLAGIEARIGSPPWKARQFQEELLEKALTRVACTASGEVIGYAVARRQCDWWQLMILGVTPDWQGRGVGKRLLLDLLEKACAQGGEGMELEVRASNGPALGLYERCGFSRQGERPGYYLTSAAREPAVLMGYAFRRESGTKTAGDCP